jgi:phosphate transport system permease protein
MATSVAPASQAQPKKQGFQMGESFAHLGTMIFAGSILVITGLVVYVLITKAQLAIGKFGFGFFSGTNWDPVAEQFGAWPFVYGTLLTSFLALAIAVPLGVGAAIFLAELAPPRISSILTFLVELLAAVPSVIYGLLAIFTVVPLMRDYIEPGLQSTLGFLPFFQGQIFGVGYLTAAFVLAIMTFPFIISISREALLDVPREQREAALALGATHWESTYQIVVPNAAFGIVGAVFLGLARALGETMAVTMVIGNNPAVSSSWLAAGYTIPAVIANEFSEASGMHSGALILLALVLFMITMVINAAARLLLAYNARRSA